MSKEDKQRQRRDDALLSAAAAEASLVWRRYNAMLVAHSVVLGATGHVALSDGTSASQLAAVIIGLAVVVSWWVMTTLGWSLGHALLEALSPEAKVDGSSPYAVYLAWRGMDRRDLMWWCAHTVIIIFGIAYVALGAYILSRLGHDAVIVVLFCLLCVAILLYAGLRWSLRRHSITSSHQ